MESVALWIQVIASCLLVLLTGLYAYLTRRLVEEGNTAFLNFVIFGDFNKSYKITVQNNGLGVALDVKVYLKLNSLVKSLEDEEDISMIVQTTGPTVVPMNEKANFWFEDGKYNKGDGLVPIFITYRTLSGKRFIYQWVYDPANEPSIRFVKQHKKLKL